jgi:uncharacterized protein
MQIAQMDARTARRLALTAQGFGGPAPKSRGAQALVGTVDALRLIQIDSVNVLVRSHYLPLFSRTGHYDRAALDGLAFRPDGLFEYWGHEASLIPMTLQPLFRWRMAQAREGKGVWGGPWRFAKERPEFVARVLAEARDRGPLAARELGEGGKATGSWWGWSDGKRAMEYLFWTGQVTTAARGRNFERIYDLTERVIPPAVMARATPTPPEAHRALVLMAAQAMGVATAADLRDYFRLGLEDTRSTIAALVQEGALRPVQVEGWRHVAYVQGEPAQSKRFPRAALLSPFDNLIWARDRTERLFGTRVRLEIYTPAHKREHGYYVLPFLMGEAIAARADLKADRANSVLSVPGTSLEPGADASETAAALAPELYKMARWLGLDGVAIRGGDAFSRLLKKALPD